MQYKNVFQKKADPKGKIPQAELRMGRTSVTLGYRIPNKPNNNKSDQQQYLTAELHLQNKYDSPGGTLEKANEVCVIQTLHRGCDDLWGI